MNHSIEVDYLKLRKQLLDKMELAERVAGILKSKNGCEKSFLGFYEQFLFMVKNPETLAEKVFVVLSAKRVPIDHYHGNDKL